MLPLKDNVPTRSFPVVTVGLIAANVIVWIWEVRGTSVQQDLFHYGYYPCTLDHNCVTGALPPDHLPWYEGVFSSMFMHGGWLHIGGNMLFLWIFGNNVEDSMGRGRYLLFYLLGGLVAAYSQAAIHPADTGPQIGASGAIAGVLGGYILLYPRSRVLTLIFLFLFVTLIEIPAVIMLGIWFILQALPGLGHISIPLLTSSGVAYLAHVGGFLFGLALIKPF